MRLRDSWYVLLFFALTSTVNGQSTTGAGCGTLMRADGGSTVGFERDWHRAAQVVGAIPLANVHRRQSVTELVCVDYLPASMRSWLVLRDTTPERWNLLPARVTSIWNSAYPDERNNGVLWAGNGLSASLSAGVEVRAGVFSAALYPTIAFQSNGDFTVLAADRAGYDTLTYPHRVIDWPQRFGEDAFTLLDPGQSYAKVTVSGFHGGVSTENLWWGPGLQNAILMGGSAPGFPHAFIGTARPFQTLIGKLHLDVIWGQLKESDYFDSLPTNDTRLINGVSIAYEPRWLPGLELGFNRVFTHNPDSVSSGEFLFGVFAPVLKKSLQTEENPSGNDKADQLASFFMRWVLPAAQFEGYAEYAKVDHNRDWWDLLSEADHAQAYMLGFQKLFLRGGSGVRIQGELTHLNASTSFLSGRGGGNMVTYYIHSRIRQGYTNRGQIMGAWIGPGAQSEHLAFDVIRPKATWGGYVERIIRDNDHYYEEFADTYRRHGHDAEFAFGARGSFRLSAATIGWRAGHAVRRNRGFIYPPPPSFAYIVEHNWSLEMNGLIDVNHWLRGER